MLIVTLFVFIFSTSSIRSSTAVLVMCCLSMYAAGGIYRYNMTEYWGFLVSANPYHLGVNCLRQFLLRHVWRQVDHWWCHSNAFIAWNLSKCCWCRQSQMKLLVFISNIRKDYISYSSVKFVKINLLENWSMWFTCVG